MSEVSKRLEQAGMLLPAVATPVAAYTPAIALESAGGLVVRTSGQIPVVDGELVANGASDTFGKLFDQPHIRSAVGVAALPLGAPCEVEVEFLARS